MQPAARLRLAALIVGGAAAAFWLWFGIASAASEGLGLGNWIGHVLVPGGILALTLLLAAWREGLGGSLLVLEGLIAAVGYPLVFGSRFPPATVLFVLATLALPPLASGILFLIDAARTRRAA